MKNVLPMPWTKPPESGDTWRYMFGPVANALHREVARQLHRIHPDEWPHLSPHVLIGDAGDALREDLSDECHEAITGAAWAFANWIDIHATEAAGLRKLHVLLKVRAEALRR